MKKHRIKRGPGLKKAWTVWHKGDASEGSGYSGHASKDKAVAQKFLKRLQDSHPGERYELRKIRIPSSHIRF